MPMTGYFDDSGTHAESPTVTMGGYIAMEGEWKRFERETNRLFKAEAVKLFRATRFVHQNDDFRGWSEARQLRFATEWFSIAKSCVVCGAAVSINKADFLAVKRKAQAVPQVSAYAYCLSIIIEKFGKSGSVWNQIESHGLNVVLEAGNPKRELGVGLTLQKLVAHNNLQGRIRYQGVAPKGAFKALQLADYLAHFSWRQSDAALRGRLDSRSALLDVATNGLPTIITLAEEFQPNPSYRL